MQALICTHGSGAQNGYPQGLSGPLPTNGCQSPVIHQPSCCVHTWRLSPQAHLAPTSTSAVLYTLCTKCRFLSEPPGMWAIRRSRYRTPASSCSVTSSVCGQRLWSPLSLGPLALQVTRPPPHRGCWTWVTDHRSTMGSVTQGSTLPSTCSSLDSEWEMGDFLLKQ